MRVCVRHESLNHERLFDAKHIEDASTPSFLRNGWRFGKCADVVALAEFSTSRCESVQNVRRLSFSVTQHCDV